MFRILLTNDDGIHSDGLIKLEEALREVGDVYTVAPASEMSGASHSLTLSRPLRIRRIDERHWTVDGTPTDCVTLALHRILGDEERPHLCVSGINHGGNLGDDASYSGTVAGALEATILGVPGLAFSLVARENFDFTEAARFAVVAVRKVLGDGPARRHAAQHQHPARRDSRRARHAAGHQARAPHHQRAHRPARQGLLLDRRRVLHLGDRGGHGLPRRRARLRLRHADAQRHDRPQLSGRARRVEHASARRRSSARARISPRAGDGG